MNRPSVILYTSIAWGILLIIGLLFGHKPQRATLQIPLPSQFNTIQYTTGARPNQDITYTLPNGIIMFSTTLSTKDYDYNTDDSIQRYVSRQIPLNNIEYQPTDLVPISKKWLILANPSMQLRAPAQTKLNDMAAEFYEIFGDKLVIVSAYRSYAYQKKVKKWCSDTLCALPGRSEHQLGLAIDIFAATTAGSFLSKAEFKKYYTRLSVNAHRYGRHNTYQKGVEIDTYQPEPRHRRYVGRELATELFERKITLAEWVKEKKKT